MALSTEASQTSINETTKFVAATRYTAANSTEYTVGLDEPPLVSNDWLYILTYLGIGAAAILFICLAIFGLRNYFLGINTALVVKDTEADKNEETYYEGVGRIPKFIAKKFVKNNNKAKEAIITGPSYIEKQIKSGDTVTVSADGTKIVCRPYTLYFPTGAVSSDQEIAITLIPGVSRNDNSFCIAPTLRCCPSGSKFKKPVKVVLKSSFGSRIKNDLVEVPIFTRHDETKPWKKVEKVQLGTDGCLTYKIKHFSDYSPQPNRRELPRAVCFLSSIAWIKNSGQNLKTLLWYICSRENERYIDTVIKSHDKDGSLTIGLEQFTANADEPLLMQLPPTTGLSIRPPEIRIEPECFNEEVYTVSKQFIIKYEDGEKSTHQRYAIKQTNSADEIKEVLGGDFWIDWEDLSRAESVYNFSCVNGTVHVGDNYSVQEESTPMIGRPNNSTATNATPSPVTRRNPIQTSSNRRPRGETAQRYSSAPTHFTNNGEMQAMIRAADAALTRRRNLPQPRETTDSNSSTSSQSNRPPSQEIHGLPAARNARPSSSSTTYSTLERSYQPTNNRDENTIETGGRVSVRDRVSLINGQLLSRT